MPLWGQKNYRAKVFTVFIAVYDSWATMLVKLLIECLHKPEWSLWARSAKTGYVQDVLYADFAGAKIGVITPPE